MMKLWRVLSAFAAFAAAAVSSYAAEPADWLLDPSPYVASVDFNETSRELTLTNGLVARRILLAPNAATVSLRNLATGEEFVRALAPEARVTLDGKPYPVGGLTGAPVANYWREEWAADAQAIPDAYRYERYEVGEIEERFPYKKRPEWLSRDLAWPPKGKRVSLFFAPPQTEDGKPLPAVEVRYEIYDGAPLLSKQLRLHGDGMPDGAETTLDTFVNEELKLVENYSNVEQAVSEIPYNIGVLSDYVYGGMDFSNLEKNVAFQLQVDPDYPTQVNYQRKTLCLLVCSPELGPSQIIKKGADFESNMIFEFLFDGSDRERRGLTRRRVMRVLAPWTAENPLMFHKLGSKPEDVRAAIEQCRETGFETLIMSFGSGFNLESADPNYRETYRKLSLEAKEAGVALGGYSLTASRGAGDPKDNVVNPKPRYGVCPCLQSVWGQNYLKTLKEFMGYAEFGIFENDGPYPGDFCESTDHPGHRGKEDSVWTQRRAQADLYRWCRAHGVYVNQPDSYFLDGGNKTGMGYRETNWSLPRAEQVVIERQNVFDGTWDKSASLGWMFVPLSQYHGGGAAATIEPLKDHLDHYDARFADLIGAGVQACWRGPRLYDSDETKAVVKKWVDFYKANRRALDSDIIHLRRATGRDWDGWLHVDPDPNVTTRGLAFFYNPKTEPITRKIRVSLYYTGLKSRARVRLGDADLKLGEPFEIPIDGMGNAEIEITIPAEKYAWAVFEAAE